MNFSSSIFLGSCIALGYLSFLVLMGGQLLDTSRCHHVFFCLFCRGVLHPTAGFIQLGLLLERLEAEASTPLSQQTGWNEQRLGKATTHPMNLSQRNGGGWGGAIHQVGWCFWCGPCFCNFCREFIGTMMNGMIREKHISHKIWVIFFFNFSTVMPMRFYLHGDVRYLAFFFTGVFFNKTIGICCFFIFFFEGLGGNNLNPAGAWNSMWTGWFGRLGVGLLFYSHAENLTDGQNRSEKKRSAWCFFGREW